MLYDSCTFLYVRPILAGYRVFRRLSSHANVWSRLVLVGAGVIGWSLGAAFEKGAIAAPAESEKRLEGKPAQVGILGPDNRVAVTASVWPWSAIGRINQSGYRATGHCTGTLIGPRHVLTAAHCLVNRRLQRLALPSEIHFLLGYGPQGYAAHRLARHFLIAPGFELTAQPPQADLRQDWAVVELETPLPTVSPLPVVATGTLAARFPGPVSRAGYSKDAPHQLRVHENCAVVAVRREGQLLVHDCDATFGDSGSALLWRQGENVEVAGVHVASGNQRSVAVGAAAFASLAGCLVAGTCTCRAGITPGSLVCEPPVAAPDPPLR